MCWGVKTNSDDRNAIPEPSEGMAIASGAVPLRVLAVREMGVRVPIASISPPPKKEYLYFLPGPGEGKTPYSPGTND